GGGEKGVQLGPRRQASVWSAGGGDVVVVLGGEVVDGDVDEQAATSSASAATVIGRGRRIRSPGRAMFWASHSRSPSTDHVDAKATGRCTAFGRRAQGLWGPYGDRSLNRIWAQLIFSSAR